MKHLVSLGDMLKGIKDHNLDANQIVIEQRAIHLMSSANPITEDFRESDTDIYEEAEDYDD